MSIVPAALLGALLPLVPLAAPAQAAAAKGPWVTVERFESIGNTVSGKIRHVKDGGTGEGATMEYDFTVTPGNSGLNSVYLKWTAPNYLWNDLDGRTKEGHPETVHLKGQAVVNKSGHDLQFRVCYDVSLSPDRCGDPTKKKYSLKKS